MKKRIVLILGLCVFMLFSASCGGAKESPAAAAETVPEAPEKADKDAGEEKSEMIETVEAEVAEDADDKAYEEFSESFSAYDEGVEIYFSPVSMALQE